MRLGPTEFAPSELSVESARDYFFFVAGEVTPGLAGTLYFDILPIYLGLLNGAGLVEEVYWAVQRHLARHSGEQPQRPFGTILLRYRKMLFLRDWRSLLTMARLVSPSPLRLVRTLRAWGDSFGVGDKWCLDRALTTLAHWALESLDEFLERSILPEGALPLTIGIRPLAARPLPPSAHPVTTEETWLTHTTGPVWHPHAESRTEARERALNDYTVKLDQKFDEVAELVIARGWQRAPRKNTDEHFVWLAQYQCMAKSQAMISEAECRSRQAVSEAIGELARFMGLTLRGPRRGRPLGSRDGAPRRRVY